MDLYVSLMMVLSLDLDLGWCWFRFGLSLVLCLWLFLYLACKPMHLHSPAPFPTAAAHLISAFRSLRRTAAHHNPASQKAFEKAGFVFDHANDDGDVLYFIKAKV